MICSWTVSGTVEGAAVGRRPIRGGQIKSKNSKAATLKRLSGHAVLAGLAQLLVRGGLIIAFLLFARQFGTEAFAALGYFNISLIAIIAFAAMGATTLAAKLFAVEEPTPEDRKHRGALGMFMLLSASLAALGALVMPSEIFGGASDALLVATIFLAVLGAMAAGALAGRQAFLRLAVHAAIAASIMLVLAYLAGQRADISLALLAIATAYAGKAFLDLLGLAGGLNAARPDHAAWGHVIRAVAALAGSSVIWAVGMWAIAALVKTRLGTDSFALYVVGIQWYAIGMFVAANLTRALLPYQVRDARAGRRSVLMGPAMMIAMAASIGLALLAFLARPVVGMAYGPELAGLGDILWVFIAASVSVAPANMLSNQLIAEGRESRWFMAALGWALILALSLPIAFAFGLAAVIACLVLANLGMIAIAQFYLSQERPPCPA